jgi:peptide methionine sulfoxide reductase MsrB
MKYVIVSCLLALFAGSSYGQNLKSDKGHESWPSFYEPLRKTSVRYQEDNSFGMTMNSISLDFEPNSKSSAK